MLSPSLWLIFALAFLLLKTAFDSGKLLDGVRVRRVGGYEASKPAPRSEENRDALRKAA